MSELRAMSTLLFVINLVMMLAVAIAIGIAPVITRRTLLFGVRIPEEAGKDETVIKLKNNYIKRMIIIGILAIIALIIQYLISPGISILATLYLPLVVIVAQFITYVSKWKQATALKAKNKWTVPMTSVVDTASSVQRENLWGFPKLWYIPSILVVLALIVLSIIRYPSLPGEIATHWNFEMKPDAWADKSYWIVLAVPLLTLVMIGVMMLGNITVYRMKLQINTERPELSYAQHRVYRNMMSTAIGIATLFLVVFSGVIQLMTLQIHISTVVMIIVTVAMITGMCIPFMYVYIKAGQSGCKLNPQVSIEDISDSSSSKTKAIKNPCGDDKFWKLGLFYYNENDPAVLVEDRFGNNGSFNYARPAAKAIVGLLIIMVVVVYIGTTIMFVIS